MSGRNWKSTKKKARNMRRNKEEFREAREELGMSAGKLAKTLRMGKGCDRTIRRYESGETSIPGPVSVAMEALLTGFRPEEIDEDDD